MKDEKVLSRVFSINFKELKGKDIAFLALFIAFVAIATYIAIPGPYGSYFNLGEIAIYLTALLCGPLAGALAGALGAALTDLVLGYSMWVPFTLVIKGLEGYLVGKLSKDLSMKKSISGVSIGGLWMALAYALASAKLYGWPAFLPEFLIDILQASIGAAIAIPLSIKLNRALKRKVTEI